MERKESVKGTKDQIDIMALLFYAEVNIKMYFDLLKKYKLENYFSRLKSIINNFKNYSYLELNPRQFKMRKSELLARLIKY